MEEVLEQRKLMAATAAPPGRVKAFQAKLAEVRRRHPNQWVVYTSRWDDAAGEYAFVVHGPFATQSEAVKWTFTRPDKERGTMTVCSTRLAKPGYRLK